MMWLIDIKIFLIFGALWCALSSVLWYWAEWRFEVTILKTSCLNQGESNRFYWKFSRRDLRAVKTTNNCSLLFDGFWKVTFERSRWQEVREWMRTHRPHKLVLNVFSLYSLLSPQAGDETADTPGQEILNANLPVRDSREFHLDATILLCAQRMDTCTLLE
jgi:hypothetical protein